MIESGIYLFQSTSATTTRDRVGRRSAHYLLKKTEHPPRDLLKTLKESQNTTIINVFKERERERETKRDVIVPFISKNIGSIKIGQC